VRLDGHCERTTLHLPVGSVVPNYRGWKSLTIASRSFTSTEYLLGHVHSHSLLPKRTGSFPCFSSLIFGFVAQLIARLKRKLHNYPTPIQLFKSTRPTT
jgi:hypothetical protein